MKLAAKIMWATGWFIAFLFLSGFAGASWWFVITGEARFSADMLLLTIGVVWTIRPLVESVRELEKEAE